MKRRYITIIFLISVFIVTTAAAQSGAKAKITVNQAAEKITITGGDGKKITSDKFALSKDEWYIIKISYTGPEISTCQLSLVTQKMITDNTTVAGMLTNWIGPTATETIRPKGSANSEDYMIYVEEAGGPWTVEILKSPKPSPVSSETKFSGTANKVTPFFRLKGGSATFTMHQALKSRFSSRLAVDLYNADTGEFVGNVCHNDPSPTLTATIDIPAAGNYILAVSSGDSWDISFTQ